MVKHMCNQRLPQPVPTTETTPPPPPLALAVPLSSSPFMYPYQITQDSPCSVTSLTSQDHFSSQTVADVPYTLNRKETLSNISPALTDRERGRRKGQRLFDEGDNKYELQNVRSPLSSCENGGRRDERLARDDQKVSQLTCEKAKEKREIRQSLSCEGKRQRLSQRTRAERSRSPCHDNIPVFVRSPSNSSHRRERSSSVSSLGHDCIHDSQRSSGKGSRPNSREKRARSPHHLHEVYERRQRSRSPHEQYREQRHRERSPHERYREQERRLRLRSPHELLREQGHRRSPHEHGERPHYLHREQELRRRSRSPHERYQEREYRDRLRPSHRESNKEKERLSYRSPDSHRKQEERTRRTCEEHHTPTSHREREIRLRPTHISRDDSRGSNESREESPRIRRSSRNTSGSPLIDHRSSESTRELRKTESRLRRGEHDLRTQLDRSGDRHSVRLKSKNDQSVKEQSRSSLQSQRRSRKNGTELPSHLSLVPSNTSQEASPTEQLLLETASFPVLSEDGLLISDSPIKKRDNPEQKTILTNGTCTTEGSPRTEDISTDTSKPQSNGSFQTVSDEDEFEEGEILSD